MNTKQIGNENPGREGKNPDSMIEELKTMIQKSAEEILKYSPNIIYEIDIYDQDDEYFSETTETARQLIEKHSIKLYRDECDSPVEVHSVLKSMSTDEFVSALTDYAEAMSDWSQTTKDLFYDEIRRNTHGNIEDISKAKYIVKVYHADPCWCMGQLYAVICCESNEQAEKVANHVWRNWGDYGVPGGNIGTKIVEVDSETEERVIYEYAEDIIRYITNYHTYHDLTVYNASDIID
jgi:hypothetical protein